MSTLSPLATELLQYLLSSDEGYSDDQLKRHFGDRYVQLVPHVNELLMFNRLQLYNRGESLYYKAIKEDTAAKFAGLGPEQILVYQAIERSGNKGIWTRDIKVNTNISQNTLTKTLKILEQRNLIKSIRSVVSKSKKLYMVFDMVPAKEITGGPWYSDQEFDHDFVNALGEIIVNIVQKGNIVSLQDIAHKVRISGVSKVDLSLEELELVVNTLIYDYRLEEVRY
jgi:DNA-directed RNA polymerase III subunit RPC6